MRETAIISRIRELAQAMPTSKKLVHGIGDDGAVFRPQAGEDLVFTTDFVLENRHFTLDTHSAADIGHKALARSLSDLAAMGSTPAFCLVSLAIPPALSKRWVSGFYRGLLTLATQHHIVLAGGDLARFSHVVADVMCCGRVPQGRALLRSTARRGDCIYVTGELGGSAHGLRTKKGKHWRRHCRPTPRVAIGLALRRLGVVTCMDLSDGLALDLRRLCLESGVSAELSGLLPIAPGACFDEAIGGGEDYELLFTAPAKVHVPSEIEGISITRIGIVGSGMAGTVQLNGQSLPIGGFDHFS